MKVWPIATKLVANHLTVLWAMDALVVLPQMAILAYTVIVDGRDLINFLKALTMNARLTEPPDTIATRTG